MARPDLNRAHGQSRLSTRLLRAALAIAILVSFLPGRTAEAQTAACFAAPTSPLPAQVSVGMDPASVAIGDFNDDGKPDLAVANLIGTTVSIRLGSGHGTFAPAADVVVGTTPWAVAIGDFNGDRRADLAATNFNDSSVSIRLGTGTGTFTNPPTGPANIAVGGQPRSMVIGDLNGDTTPDLAVANINSFPGTVSIRLGVGDGSFVNPPSGPAEIAVQSNPAAMAMGDLNGDTRPDLVVTNLFSNSVSIRLGVGDGSFVNPPSGPADISIGNAPASIVLTDLNGDGKLDFAVTNDAGSRISIRLGVGDGTFTGGGDVGVGLGPIHIEWGDVNGDGTPDLAIANFDDGTVSIRLGNGDGTFTNAADVIIGAGSLPSAVAVGDLNGDGRLDLAVANRGLNNVSIRLGNGDGTFGGSANVPVEINPESVAIGDVNGDLKGDLVVANTGSDTVSIRLGNGNGTFSTAANVAVGATPKQVALGDLNGDGKLDLAVVNENDNSVSIRLGNGNGIFNSTAELPVGAVPRAVAIGDLNGDGRLDLAVANRNAHNVSIRLGVGNGSFTSAENVAVGSTPVSVALGDYNGDGRLDLAVANLGTDNVSIRLGTGTGVFTAATPPEIAVGTVPSSIAAGDLNGDGRLDLSVANFAASTTSILLGTGSGTFTGPTNVTVGPNPRSVAIGDLNGDGMSDLAVSSDASNTVSIRLGNGNGIFTSAADVPVGSAPNGLALGQINEDGRLDLAVTSVGGDSVSIRLNTCGQDLVPQPRVPGAQTVSEDGALGFGPATGNAITIADDGRSATIHATATAVQGTLTLGTTAGLRIEVGDGTADPTITFNGTLAQVNAALTGLTFRPSGQYHGPALLTVTVHDNGHGGTGSPRSSTASVPITVTAVNDPPTAANDSYTAASQTPLTIAAPGVLANDTDADSLPGSLTAVVMTTPTRGSLSLNPDGGFTYTPNLGVAGTDSFTYQARDGSTPSGPATVTIIVGNAAPTAGNDTFTVAAGTLLTVEAPGVLANDADADSGPAALSAVLVMNAAHGLLSLSPNGGFTYIPAVSFTGTDTFSYRASDGTAQSSPTTVTITVAPTACVPRPQVRTSPASGGNRLEVHVEATPLNTRQSNPLQRIVFGTLQNARVTVNGQSIASSQTVTVSGDAVLATFTVERVTPGQPTMVPFTVVDGCGEWKSFVGGGARAGF